MLTGLVLAVVLAFAWRTSDETEAAQPSPATITIPEEAAPDSLDGLKAENEQLRSALNLLQQRDEAYRSQLEQANQTILEMQQSSATVRFEDDDDEEYEHEEYEREHEADEHEEYEHDD